MNKFSSRNWLISLLLLVPLVACVCVWGPTIWTAAANTFQRYPSLFPCLFYGALIFFGLLPIMLVLGSIFCCNRFTTLFRVPTVIFGLCYSLFITACAFFFFWMFLLIGLGIDDNHPVEMRVSGILFLVSLLLVGAVLLFDTLKFHPSFKEARSRIFVCFIYSPCFFLTYLFIWQYLCKLVSYE